MSKPPASNLAAADDDAFNPKVSASALDFLLIELVPQAQRTASQVHARDKELRDAFSKSKILGNGSKLAVEDRDTKKGAEGEQSNGKEDGVASTANVSTVNGSSADAVGGVMDDEVRDAVYWRLDGLGYRVGQGLVERFSAGKPRPQNPLDAIKFICKDLWQLVFRKQIDNLKTNHRGIFVLTDNRFQPLSRMSVDRLAGPKAAEQALSRAQSYLYFPAGIIRGALAGLGIEATVSPESTELPTATFQIKTKGAKA